MVLNAIMEPFNIFEIELRSGVADEVMSNSVVAPMVVSKASDLYEARTPLGRKLIAIREKAISSGVQLWSADEILDEVKRRRGGIEWEEEDLRGCGSFNSGLSR